MHALVVYDITNACARSCIEKWGGNCLHCLIASYTPVYVSWMGLHYWSMLAAFQFLSSLVLPHRYTPCNFPNFQQSVQNPHLHFHWWTCYHCHMEERWSCDNSQCYLPTDQESSWSCCRYLPDSARHWPISESEWHCGDIQLYSGECQGKIINDSDCIWQWWVDNKYILMHADKNGHLTTSLYEITFPAHMVHIGTSHRILTSIYQCHRKKKTVDSLITYKLYVLILIAMATLSLLAILSFLSLYCFTRRLH